MEIQNREHTVIIPNHNTLPHLKNTYNSLVKYGGNVKIIIIDDASEDGTQEWLQTLVNEPNVQIIISPTRAGHTFWYDEGMRQAKTDIVSILHSDMIIGPNYFENMLKYLEPGKVVCATRIEPPIHPAGNEKIVKDFGDEADNFKWDLFTNFVNQELEESKDKTTKGIFAPWMLYKKDHLKIGGHDQRFAPYGYEDSDIFNRWILAGYEMVQSRDALCYHMTCRGHRWNAGVGIENSDYKSTMERCRKEFLRKWGDWIHNDSFQHPIIHPKYDIAFRIFNSNLNLLTILEPWCSKIYVDNSSLVEPYIQQEQPNTQIDLSNKINIEGVNSEITVRIDGNTFNQQDLSIIQQLPQIIQDSGEIGKFKLNNLEVSIQGMTEFQNDLINI